MFTEIVKLVPTLDRAAMAGMFNLLNSRFTSVAKKFGQGLKNAMKLSPFLAIGGAILAKILNPLQKAEEIIDKILGKAGDINDTAEELGTSPGTLARLEAVAGAKGVDPQTLRTLLGKFQSDLAQERTNQANEQKAIAKGEKPLTQPGLLREFTSETDTAQAFFSFIQSMQKLDKDTQTLVQNQIFGEKIRGRVAAFLNESDYGRLLKPLPQTEVINAAVARADAMSDTRDLQTVVRDLQDFVVKADLIQPKMIQDFDTAQRQKNDADNETLRRYDALKSTSIAVQELTHKFDNFTTKLINDTAPLLVRAIEDLTKLVGEMMPTLVAIKDWTAGAFDSTLDAIAQLSVSIGDYWQEFKNSRVFKWFGR